MLEELQNFVRNESGIPNVSLIEDNEPNGISIFIDHGTEEYTKDANVLMVSLPVTISVRSDKKDWRRVLKTAEIIQRELRNSKKHKVDVGAIEREDSDSLYVLVLNIVLPFPIS